MNIVRGQVAVATNNDMLLSVVAGTSNAPLLPPGGTVTGGTGSYLDSIIIRQQVLTTVGSCAVYLADNTSGTVQIHGSVVSGTAGAPTEQVTKQFFIGATSQFGPWRISTQANSAVTAIGKFTK